MTAPFRPRTWLLFGLRFLAVAIVLVPLWWLIAPYYGWFLVQCGGVLLRDLWGMPLTAGHIETRGILHTESALVFYLDDHPARMKFVQLITNLPPFVALMVATPALPWRYRVTTTLLGASLLGSGHVLFIVLALRFSTALQQHGELPTALAQFYLTLPFLLWIVLAYGHRFALPNRAQSEKTDRD